MPPDDASDQPGTTEVPFREALRFWVKLGFISFGGPAGQIAILHRELVERRRWISETRFLHALNYCMLLPGPEAQQLATYMGWLLHRTAGGLVAGALFVVPSCIVLYALSFAYAVWGEIPLVAGVMAGFKSVVVAIVAEAVLRIGRRALRSWAHGAIAAAAFVAIYFLHVPFPAIVLGAGVLGFAGSRLRPAARGPREAAPTPAGEPGASPLLRDDAPPPDHTLPSRARALRTLGVGVVLWVLPFALLAGWLGWNGVPLQQYRFYTGAAMVTFGGAYAVLAYVTQAAVNAYGWISSTQAVDGLALAETTPGPLIMVVQFVGFMTGWNHPGPLTPVVAATLGAVVTTWVTFLPCFLFVFLGAPYMEVLRNNRALNGALAGVTASVLGVILNLALVFGAAVCLPDGPAGGVRWFPVLVAAAAFFAMARWRVDALWIVIGGGLTGLVHAWLA